MRCCANCEWSISPELEDEIMEEQGYEEEDINRPKAGDCVLGMQHNDNFVCSEHLYSAGPLSTDIMYDEQYMGSGYLIITSYYDELVRFMKISGLGNHNFPVFKIRAFEKDSKDS